MGYILFRAEIFFPVSCRLFFGLKLITKINNYCIIILLNIHFTYSTSFFILMCLNFFSIFVQWYYGIPVYVMYIHNYIYNFIAFFLFSSRFLDIFFSALNWNFFNFFPVSYRFLDNFFFGTKLEFCNLVPVSGRYFFGTKLEKKFRHETGRSQNYRYSSQLVL